MACLGRSVVIFFAVIFGIWPVLGQIHRIEGGRPYHPSELRFLKRLVTNRSVVQLGESIHLTDEFPRVRLHIVQYLHKQVGFDVLALEGSALDSWLAQDHLYRSKEAPAKRAAEAQRIAWFGLWQTDAMRELMTYVLRSQAKTRKPLYLASFDVQPGSSPAFGGRALPALEALFQAVERYASPPEPAAFDRWKAALSPYLRCYGRGELNSDEQRRAAERSLAELRDWFAHAAPQIRPAIHGRALNLVAESLRGTIELCSISPARPFGNETYQRVRDRLNAMNSLTIRDIVSKSHRIMVWAHHSHVHHNSSGQRIPSMGQHLLAMIGDGLYTIGLFAGDGEAIEVNDTADPPFRLKPLRAGREFGIESALQDLAKFDYFVDLTRRSELPKALRQVSSGRIELDGAWPFIVERDFHAVIFVQKVSAPEPLAAVARSEKRDEK